MAKKIESVLPQLLNELGRLQEARELLEQVWEELGPYGHGGLQATVLTQPTVVRLQRFFNFDDNE